MKQKTIQCAYALLICLPLLAACSSSPKASPYPQVYLDRQIATPVSRDLSPREQAGKKAFENVFSHLKAQDLAARIESSYAENIYFNDTFKTLKKRSELIHYLRDTVDNTPNNQVTLLDVFSSGEDIYIKWQMAFSFSVFGSEKHSQSIGITHLTLNDQGKITMHQDFWDGVEGFYQHLPVLGGWIRNIREDL